jgi:hypothetical protein
MITARVNQEHQGRIVQVKSKVILGLRFPTFYARDPKIANRM